jgi:biopolymer transport protein ExbB
MIEIIERGGPIIWPLLLTSIITLATIIERMFFLLRFRFRMAPLKREHFSLLLSQGKIKDAISLAQVTNDPILQAIYHSYDEKKASFLISYQKQAREVLRCIHRGIPTLDTAITIAPLLGLLGTVVGLIHSFYSLGESQITAPIAITGGISEALIATAFGLAIAIIALLPYNILNELEDTTRAELEALGTAVEDNL